MKIIPYTEEFEKIISKRIPWTFLHGKLDDDAKYDIFGVITDLDVKNLPAGIYHCTFKLKPCTLFYWQTKIVNLDFKKGLVVYNDDAKSFEYAKKCYDLNVESI